MGGNSAPAVRTTTSAAGRHHDPSLFGLSTLSDSLTYVEVLPLGCGDASGGVWCLLPTGLGWHFAAGVVSPSGRADTAAMSPVVKAIAALPVYTCILRGFVRVLQVEFFSVSLYVALGGWVRQEQRVQSAVAAECTRAVGVTDCHFLCAATHIHQCCCRSASGP